MHWVNFLHLYQPHNQKPYWVKKIANESYRKLIKGLLANRQAKAVININACLVELFQKNGCQDIINGLRTLARRDQIEFTDSAKFHAFLPLLPEKEIIRQIKLNHQTNKKYFGSVYKPQGFFPPEMGYNQKVAKICHILGYKWLIIDELALEGKIGNLNYQTIYQIKSADNLSVFFRQREISFRILSAQVYASHMIVDLFKSKNKPDEFVITAMDGETFGHHRPGLDELLFEVYQSKEIQTHKMSELFELFPKRQTVEPIASSWALMKRDLEQKTPYSRWHDKNNDIHRWQWQLTNLSIKETYKLSPKNPSYQKIRTALDKSLHSDQYWWASAMPWWSLELIEKGAKEFVDVILKNPVSAKKSKILAEELYKKIVFTGFAWQKSGKVEELAKISDEDVTQRISKEMPYIPLAEFNRIVSNLRAQMLAAANNLEYERAAQIRNRIKELEEKKDQLTKKH
ncbi:MAG: UvrB/UvrC motif-containing protein [bacterium]